MDAPAQLLLALATVFLGRQLYSCNWPGQSPDAVSQATGPAVSATTVLCGARVPDTPFSGVATPRSIASPDPAIAGFEQSRSIASSVTPNLVDHVRAACTQTFVSPGDIATSPRLRLGDILVELRLQNTPAERARLLRRYAANNAELAPGLVSMIEELVDSSWLAKVRSNRTPWGSEDQPDDGFFVLADGTISAATLLQAWPRANKPNVAQIATLVWPAAAQSSTSGTELACRTFEAVKRAERALDEYPAWVGLKNPYSLAELVNGEVFTSPSNSFRVWTLRYTSLGKFLIFSGSETHDLIICEHFDNGSGALVDYYSLDSRWTVFSGRDVYFPAYTASGSLAALVMVTTLICDRDDPWRLVRENLGNLRLRSGS